LCRVLPDLVEWFFDAALDGLTGAGSQSSFSRPPDLLPLPPLVVPLVDVPAGTTGQLTDDALSALPRDSAVHFVHAAPDPDGEATAGAMALSGMPVTQVIEPLAARIGALIAVLVVVVVTVMI
jgi:hypothetical protein